MKKTAIYPGTFDPITFGHIDVIKKALKLFDKVVVAVSDVENKDYLFDAQERKEIVRKALFVDLKLKDGDVKIELFEDVAPNHVKRIKELAEKGMYDNVVFHRVIDGFMAQTGDVKFGKSDSNDFDLRRAGMGGSDQPDLKEEFSSLPHDRGTLSMARSSDPNSANSQFFICFKAAPFLDRQYTVFGKVIEGMENVDKIKRGDENNNGSVNDPDKIISFKSL